MVYSITWRQPQPTCRMRKAYHMCVLTVVRFLMITGKDGRLTTMHSSYERVVAHRNNYRISRPPTGYCDCGNYGDLTFNFSYFMEQLP